MKRGGMKFIETAHVKDLLAHLRVVANPLDTVSWHRVLMLVEGVGPKKAQDVMAAIVKSDNPYRRPARDDGASRERAQGFSLDARKSSPDPAICVRPSK